MKQLALLLFFFSLTGGFGQLENQGATITCIGRTISHNGQLSDYLLWQSEEESATFGKTFAIYRKAGGVDSANPYQLMGRQSAQTAPAVVLSLLKQGSRLDYDGSFLPGRLAVLSAEALSEQATLPLPSELTLELANRLGEMMGVAVEDAEVAQRLQMLGRTHPGVMLVLGQGFHAPTAASETWTYEVRETDFDGSDFQVVGRVTLDADAPVALSQPGPPVSVTRRVHGGQQLATSPMDHLNGRFRWRNRLDTVAEVPQVFGYNLYRVKEQVALDNMWTDGASPPEAFALEALASASLGQEDPDCVRANDLPILPNKTLGAEAYELQVGGDESGELVDRESFFFVDDIKSSLNPLEPLPFVDGDTYYYFVAPRDIAGHPGPVSAGTRFTFCSRLAPPAPLILGVDNTFEAPVAFAEIAQLRGEQRFKLRILPLEEGDGFTYYIYRWEYATEANERGADPTLNLVGSVMRDGDEPVIEWIDHSPGAPVINSDEDDAWVGKVVWYTLRAEDASACAPKNLSLNSPPVSGVLRDRADPGSPDGGFQICIHEPTASFEGETTKTLEQAEVGPEFEGFAIRVERVSPEIGRYRCVIKEGAPEEVVFEREGRFGNSDEVILTFPTAASSSSVSIWGYNQVGAESNEAKGVREKLSLAGVVDCLQFELDTIKNAIPNEPDTPHEVVDIDGSINGFNGFLVLPDGTWEYRVYRRVGDDGPLELIESGSGPDLPENVNWSDQAPPTANVRVCFYGQAFDENGNGGPLKLLGCTEVVTSDLPTPLLAPVKPLAAAAGNARVTLNWFCDPVGVERFVVWVATPDAPEAPLHELSGVGLSEAIATEIDLELGEEFAGLRFTGFQTQTLSSAFGPGPEFDATFTVPATGELFFVVQAVGPGEVESRPEGRPSNVVSEQWVDPILNPGNLIPWPQRGLVESGDFERSVSGMSPSEGPLYAFKAPDAWKVPAAILVGAYQDPPQPGTGKSPYQADFADYRTPESWFFRIQSGRDEEADGNEALLPFMVYRYQLPSALYENAQPNLVQLSPLLDRLSYRSLFKPALNANIYEVSDPFFRFVPLADCPLVPFAGNIGKNAMPLLDDPSAPTEPVPSWLLNDDGLIFWVDQQPVVAGAKYQYLVVHYTERGEVARVIPLNSVQQ